MFSAETIQLKNDQIHKFTVLNNGEPLTYLQVLNLWQNNNEFCYFYSKLLASSSFSGFRWETPPIKKLTVNRQFEFVLINSSSFDTRPTDANTYKSYFSMDDENHGIVSFDNLRGDATLIVPSPRTDNAAYGHLAAFLRKAPKQQVISLWRNIAEAALRKLSDQSTWISTAGGGVAWLHVRLDSTPKYYGFEPFRSAK